MAEDIEHNNEQKLVSLLQSIQEAKRLFSKRILKESEFNDLSKDIHESLAAILVPDSDIQREYEVERRHTVWRKVDANGFATDLGRLEFWESFIKKVLEERNGRIAPQQVIVQPGEYFTARTAVRDILGQAKHNIAIFDEYLDDTEILNIVEPYVANGIGTKLLKNAPSRAFVSDTSTLAKQYGHVELRSYVTKCHDRFVVLDDTVVYQFGQSLKDLGAKVTTITKLDDAEAQKYVGLFTGWWGTAQVLV
jgi:hypothetical protein